MLVFTGIHLDSLFWKETNATFCQNLRDDPYCIETETGFICAEPSFSGNMVTSSSVCEKSRSFEEREGANKRKRQIQLEQTKRRHATPMSKISDPEKIDQSISKFNSIVTTIIASENPQKLDFEKELVAIYNCLDEEYEDGAKGELIASNSLRGLLKTPVERKKYIAYCASKGRYLNPNAWVAGLPAGDKSLNCTTIFQEDSEKGP